MSDDLPSITNDDDWLDLRDGEQAIVVGRLISASQFGITILFTSTWVQLSIDCGSRGADLHPFAGRDVKLVVTRHEDGVYAESGDIAAAIERLEEDDA